MKKIFLMLATSSLCKACALCTPENTILHAQHDYIYEIQLKEEIYSVVKREELIVNQCIEYIRQWGTEEGIRLARLLLRAEMEYNPNNTVFSIKNRLNRMGFNV